MHQATNLSQVLERAATFETGITIYPPGNTAEATRLSYRDLFAAAKEKARLLRQWKDTADRTIILLHFDNHADAMEWLWATVVAGLLPVISTPLPNDHDQRRKHLLHLQSMLDDPIILTTKHLVPEFLEIKQLKLYSTDDVRNQNSGMVKTTSPYHIWYPWFLLNMLRYFSRAKLIQDNHTRLLRGHQAHPDDLAVLMLTSGSTGYSKAVCLSHGQILKAVEGKAKFHETTQETPFFNWIGIDHVANLSEIHIHEMLLASDQVHAHATDLVTSPLKFVSLLSQHQIGYTFAPNFFLALLRKSLENQRNLMSDGDNFRLRDGVDLSKLKALISGGETNVVETCDALSRHLGRYNVRADVIRPGFGMTETCAGCIYGKACPSYELALGLEFASLGSCTAGISMRIVSDEGVLTAQDEAGNLQVKGDVVFKRYYKNEPATTAAFTDDGWFITGDRAFLDAAGNLNLAGRAKESIIINGVSVYPHQLELAIEDANVAGVTRSFTAVFSHRPLNSETERFCVVYHPTYAANDIAMRVETTEAIAKVSAMIYGARPYEVIPLEQSHLPKTSLGKLSRSRIKTAFEMGAYQDVQEKNLDAIQSYKSCRRQRRALTLLEDIVFLSFMDVFDFSPEDIGVESSFFEAGVTSIDLLRLKRVLQNKLGVRDIPLIIVLTNPSVQDMAKALERLTSTANQSEVGVYSPVVALGTKGSKLPLWLVHPRVGEVLVFLNLAKYITDRPVYALRARGFEQNEEFFNSIPQIVGVYYEHIKMTQPCGPYVISGYSFGAMLAFEMSKCLEARGDEVRFLGPFNLPPHIKTRMKELDWIEVAFNLGCFLGFYTEQHQRDISPMMHHKSREDVAQQIMEQAHPSRLEELSLTQRRLERWISLAHSMQNAAREYDPSGRVGNIDVFYCTPLASVAHDRKEWLSKHLDQWRDYSRNEPRFHEVQGAHNTMLDSQNVVSFQEKLKSVLAERGV